jgi:hypothetical protein
MEQQELCIRMALTNWESNVKRASDLFAGFSDKELLTEIAPSRNRLVYLLGHLTAVHDRMLSLLGLGDRRYAALDEVFITSPDKAVEPLPPTEDLRAAWKDINALLADHFQTLHVSEWFYKHTMVSEEDFAREPSRNRLNVLFSRTNHLAFHIGQMVLVKK